MLLSEDCLGSRLNLMWLVVVNLLMLKSLAKITLKKETSISFYTKIIRRTRFLIATLFSLPLQKLFLKLFGAIVVILERYFNLPALFIFLILI